MSQLIAGIPDWIIVSLILLSSVIALAIILERSYFLLRQLKPINIEEERQLLRYLQEKKYEEAMAFCRLRNHPAYNVSRVLIEARGGNIDLRSLASEDLIRELSTLERYLPTLGTISSIAPMLGLLGTVTGMIKAFSGFTTNQGSQLTRGIEEALITTALGLMVAIPALIMYNYFTRRVSSLIEEANILAEMVIAELEKK
ncbi:MAG: MotA/TolQ/ExbB proton channel family protein [Leptospiraceae bacterium]|nr:MotA/TolQ/ExbB proton channel family protein [Leptospiraceae bacterium]MDW8306337.1 MotA/TolQ/ExbB proton channel family protein [Leptospiraceae bacterium]